MTCRCGNPIETRGRRLCERCRDESARRRVLKMREYRRKIPSESPEAKRERERRRTRASPKERGYGAEHGRLRREWKPLVEAGEVACARCGGIIWPGEPWHLDHSDDRESYLGPSHRRCNLAGPELDAAEVRRRRKVSDRRYEQSRERAATLYGKDHDRLRREWATRVEAGGVRCARCLQPITGEWDLGHDDLDPTLYTGPEHRSCNRRAGGRKGATGAAREVAWSRAWLPE